MIDLKDLPSAGIYVGVFIVVVIVMSIVLQSINDDEAETSTISVVNRTHTRTVAIDTWQNLGDTLIINSTVRLTNETNKETIPQSDYAVDTINGRLLFNVSTGIVATKKINVSYNFYYNTKGDVYNVSEHGLFALDNMSGNSGTLTTVIIFGAIIGILFGVFYGVTT